MLPASTEEEFLADPRGRYLRGRSWIFFFSEAGLYGTLIAGRPEEEDVRRLVRLYPRSDRAAVDRPYPSLFDASGLTATDSGGFRVLAEWARGQAEGIESLVTRQAIVYGAGLVGAAAAGFPMVHGMRCPVALFDSREAALSWLGVDGPGVRAEIATLAKALADPGPVAALRARLAARPAGATLDGTARALGLSARSLQRSLTGAGTTFQAERSRARVERACQLMIESDAKLTSIALEVGCASLQAFSDLFRRATGEAPSAWRSRRR